MRIGVIKGIGNRGTENEKLRNPGALKRGVTGNGVN